MRLPVAALLGISLSLGFSVPVLAATEAPQPQETLPLALAVVVIAGVLAFAYFLMRPWRPTDGKD
jgi:hypothetical protein